MNPVRFVDCARRYVGTPFHHQGRLLGVGVDCIGLIVCAARDCGVLVNDFTAYSRQPDGDRLIYELTSQTDKVHEARSGDVMVFSFVRGKPQHVGIYADGGLIHTYERLGRVVEHCMTTPWWNRLHAAYRIRWPL